MKNQKDGIYSIKLNKSLIAGEHELEVSVNGTTFRRQVRKQVIVYDKPATASIEIISNNVLRLGVLPYLTIISPENINITAKHKHSNGDVQNYKLKK